jgi:hypothetical protein
MLLASFPIIEVCRSWEEFFPPALLFERSFVMKQLILFGLLCLFLPKIALGMPAQIIIIRHAEKDPSSGQLVDPQGLERAAALAYYLTATDYLQNFGPIAAIFAARPVDESDRYIARPIETVMPVAELLQLPVHSPFNGYQTVQIASLLMNSPQYDGKNILICWNHSSIIDLLHAFGYEWPINPLVNIIAYPDCHFDYTFVLTFPKPNTSPAYPSLYFQQLLFGDPVCCSGGCSPLCAPGLCPNSGCNPATNPTPCPSYTPPPTCNPCQSP